MAIYYALETLLLAIVFFGVMLWICFYLVALVISRISALAPGTLDDYFTAYCTTIEGSLILLVVFDKLIELVVKDYRNAARLTSTAVGALRGRSGPTASEPEGVTDGPAS